MLMRAYRHAYRTGGGSRRLSQTGLLDLMAQVDSGYSDRHDHSSVARWESGATRPTRERLEVFGRALELSPTEIEGLIRLAGLDLDDAPSDESQHLADPVNTIQGPSADALEDAVREETATTPGGDDSPSYARYAVRYASSRFLLPGSCVALIGYFLASLGWNSSFMLAIYVGAAMCALTSQGFVRLRRSDGLGSCSS